MIGRDGRQRRTHGLGRANQNRRADEHVIDAQHRQARRERGARAAALDRALRIGEAARHAPVGARARHGIEVADEDNGTAARLAADPLRSEQGVDLSEALTGDEAEMSIDDVELAAVRFDRGP